MIGDETRWNWFDRFDMAKLLADGRSGALRIWTCDADELFGSVSIDRTEPGGHREQWTEWTVKPTNVLQINRWRDPYSDVPNIELWQKRGVHAVEASWIVGSWFRNTDSQVAPMDRDQGGYWLSQFQQIGQFEAFIEYDAEDRASAQSIRVEPVSELLPPTRLFRGAPDALKARWSWTGEPETAEWFIRMFSPVDGKVWEAEPEMVLGLIHVHIDNPRPGQEDVADFTEWIAFPKQETVRQSSPTLTSRAEELASFSRTERT